MTRGAGPSCAPRRSTGRRALAAAAAALALLCAAPAQAEFSNGEAVPFGRIAMSAYTSGEGPQAIEAVVHFDAAAIPEGGHLLVGFNAQGDGVHARIDAVETLSGRALAGTAVAGEPARRVVPAAELAALAEPIVLRGSAWADANGRFHVGALAIAFGPGWAPVAAGGQAASLYAFTVLGQEGNPGAPVTGAGNDALAAIPLALAAAACGLLGWRSTRPAPAPRAQRAQAAQPAQPARPASPGPRAPPQLAPWTPVLAPPQVQVPRKLHVAPPLSADRLAALDRAQGRGRPRAPAVTWPPPKVRAPTGHPVRAVPRAGPFPNPMPRPRPPSSPPGHEPPPRPRGPVPSLRSPGARPSPERLPPHGTARPARPGGAPPGLRSMPAPRAP